MLHTLMTHERAAAGPPPQHLPLDASCRHQGSPATRACTSQSCATLPTRRARSVYAWCLRALKGPESQTPGKAVLSPGDGGMAGKAAYKV